MNIGDNVDLLYAIDEFLALDFGNPVINSKNYAEKYVYTYFMNYEVVISTNVVFYELYLFNFYDKIRRR